jgi:hypothetical protein
MSRLLALLLAATTLSASALGGGLAFAERNQKGNLIASLQGGVSPLRLPRDRPAPVSVHLTGSLKTADGSILPRVTAMEFGLAGRNGIDTRGLPVCPLDLVRHSRNREALAACGESLVGHGRVDAQVLVPDQPPLAIHASLLVFNGRAKGGATALLLHAYSVKPPISVVIPFTLRHPRGTFGNELVAPLPPELGPWPSVAKFSMTLSRRFSYRGSRRSVLAASCPLPPRFSSGLLSFARLGFTLEGGRHIETEIVRTCRVR